MTATKNPHRRTVHPPSSPSAPGRGCRHSGRVFLVAILATIIGAGCASTRIGAQWVDSQWPKQSLHGAQVLVVCEAQDTTVRLLCESRFAARLAALGARPISAPAVADAAGGTASQNRLAAAKAAGALAIWQTTLKPDYSAVSTGPSFSIGIGGFGGGGSRGGVGGGVGVALPVGAPGGTGLAASSTLIDAGGGNVIWSAQATAPPAPDLATQIDELADVLASGVQQAGFF